MQPEELSLLRVMAVLYRRPENAGWAWATGRGYTFFVRDAHCVLDGYPEPLAQEVRRRADLPL
jgi:hypothetical protein